MLNKKQTNTLQLRHIHHVLVLECGFRENSIHTRCLHNLFQPRFVYFFCKVSALQAYQPVRQFIAFLPAPDYGVYPLP